MPGGADDWSLPALEIGAGVVFEETCGGGGGGGKAAFDLGVGNGDAIEADFFCACIRSLYTVFSSSTFRSRSLSEN